MSKKSRREQSVERIEKKPCGCVVTHYKDGGGTLKPCPPCGIMEAAKCATGMGNALASVADHLRQQFNAATMGAAVQEAMAKKQAQAQAQAEAEAATTLAALKDVGVETDAALEALKEQSDDVPPE